MKFLADVADPVTVLGQQVSLMWIIIGAALVVFMQAGFALVETGFTQAKNAAHVVSTNFAIFGLGFIGFYLVGFSFSFGGFSYSAFGMDAPVGSALIGSGDWIFFWKGGWALTGDAITPAAIGFFLYMVAFMAMSLGAGYVDFAGSGVVHAVGGVAAFTGAIVIGPRIGKFGADGKPRTIAGHHVPMAMLGTFILLFGWFGFNAASTFAATDVQFAVAATNTAIAGAFGSIAAMLYITRKTGKPDPGMMVNGMLAGLVAITAPCAFVDPWAAAVIGTIAAVLIIEAVYFFERRGIDDPVGAISVHGVGGLFGLLSVGVFANGTYGAGWNGSTSEGVKGIIKGDWGQLGAQALGAVTIVVVCGLMSYAFFAIQNKMTKGGIRSKAEDEIAGLDLAEMGVLAYPEFQGSHK